jgi:hypothetical protein
MEMRNSIRVARGANLLTLETVRARFIVTDFKFSHPITIGQPTPLEFKIKNVGRSLGVYGISVEVFRWSGLPGGDIPLREPIVSLPLEPDAPSVDNKMGLDDPVMTQEFIDGLPTINDIGNNFVKQSHPGDASSALDSPKPTLYYVGRLIYESVGVRRELDFCYFVLRMDAATQSHYFPSTGGIGDSNFRLLSCPKWNGEHEVDIKAK